MKNFIHKILKDKDDFQHNPELKRLNEYHREVRNIELQLLSKTTFLNVKYFWKYKKLYFLKLVGLFFSFIAAIISFFFILFLFLNFFNIINISKPIQKSEPTITVCVPDTISNIQEYKNNFKKIKKINFIVFYTVDSGKDWKKFKNDISRIESSGYPDQYAARRENSQYWGKYQMGKSAREAVGCYVDWEHFSTNRELQEGFFLDWIRLLKEENKDIIKKYNNTFLNGYHITESGIIAMAHNVGSDSTRIFLNSNGKKIPKDGSGKPATRFLILGNYNLNLE